MAIITITTDFGADSPYTAEMKGAILSIARDVALIDVTHTIAPQQVLQGMLVMQQVCPAFPDQTIHVGVIDPGVGTRRAILLIRSGTHYFVGPDNGLLSFALDGATVWRMDQPRFWRSPVSKTFHGRDIMGPVAAHLASGVDADELGTRIDPKEVVRISVPPPRIEDTVLEGQIVLIDSFGNLISNIREADLRHLNGPVSLKFRGQSIPFVSTYGDVAPGDVVGLIGSSGRLEVAVSHGNAQRLFDVRLHEPISVVAGDPTKD